MNPGDGAPWSSELQVGALELLQAYVETEPPRRA
jgi:hypothetical protein